MGALASLWEFTALSLRYEKALLAPKCSQRPLLEEYPLVAMTVITPPHIGNGRSE